MFIQRNCLDKHGEQAFREGVKALQLIADAELHRSNLTNSLEKLTNAIWLVNDRCRCRKRSMGYLGAREGLYMTMCTDWDYIQVRDFEYLNDFGSDIPMQWKT